MRIRKKWWNNHEFRFSLLNNLYEVYIIYLSVCIHWTITTPIIFKRIQPSFIPFICKSNVTINKIELIQTQEKTIIPNFEFLKDIPFNK